MQGPNKYIYTDMKKDISKYIVIYINKGLLIMI